jgi:tetratricopeptide (TPR) repeat protein/predicted Ser/Thr protein kinase
MPGSVVSHYRVLNALGTGGMGVVYLAEDTALGRTVALKFLSPPILPDPKRVDRFRNEARNASALNHPNICTIYEVDEHDGELFIAMEYVEGQPLSEFLREKGMAVERVLRYGRQIAGALEHAHERGIVHRDLKPVNIIVTPKGDAKILDFGLAKRRVPDPMQKSMEVGPTETSAGLTGTLPYMSPEQLEGNDANEMSDIWSLGIILYEMASGVRPFRGENLYRLCTAILQEPMPALPDSIPAGLATAIKHCLEKDPARRYQRAAELRAALEVLESGETRGAVRNTEPDLVIPRKATRIARWIAAAIVIVALTAVGIGAALRSGKAHRDASLMPGVASGRVEIAVLPIKGAVKAEDAAFDDGLVETLTSRLTQLTETHPFAVIPTSEVRTKKVTSIDAARAEFGVNLGLLIHVQHAAGQARVNFSLVDARTHEQLRGGTITASMENPFTLQDQVSESVAQALELELQPQERRALEAHGTTEPAAYDFYLQGRGYLQDPDKTENVENALAVFHKAIEKDPGFAGSYAGLGETYWRKFQLTHDKALVDDATKACSDANAHDTGLTDAHTCLGLVYQGTGRYADAVGEYQKAEQIEPTLDSAAAGLARGYESLNRLDDAERAYKSAISLRPNYWAQYNGLGTFYLRHGRLDEAAQMYTQVIALVPDSFVGYGNLGSTRIQQGKYAEAIEPLQRSLKIRATGPVTSNLATAYFQLKQYGNAAEVFEQATALDPQDYELWGNLGDAYYWAPALREQASSAYRKAIALGEEERKVNPHNPHMLSYLAEYHAMIGEAKPAHETIMEALRIAPADPEVLYYAGMVYVQAGEDKKALESLRQSVAAGYPASSVRDTPNFDRLQNDPLYKSLVAAPAESQKGKAQ